MAGFSGSSKNNPSEKGAKSTTRMVASAECEKCPEQCVKGTLYLKRLKVAGVGKGVPCPRK
jgi:ribosomal protein L44E